MALHSTLSVSVVATMLAKCSSLRWPAGEGGTQHRHPGDDPVNGGVTAWRDSNPALRTGKLLSAAFRAWGTSDGSRTTWDHTWEQVPVTVPSWYQSGSSWEIRNISYSKRDNLIQEISWTCTAGLTRQRHSFKKRWWKRWWWLRHTKPLPSSGLKNQREETEVFRTRETGGGPGNLSPDL